MVAIPKQNKILDLLDNDVIDNSPRDYLGYSSIGEPCLRKLQYDMRMTYTSTITKRIERLFNFGHIMEHVFIKDLQRIGITVTDRQKEVVGFAGHWKGHIDGIGTNVQTAPATPHLLEFKTFNDANFKTIKKYEHSEESGVKKAFLGYYWQCQAYMGKFDLTRTLFLGYNKNDSQYYVERIYFDPEFFKQVEHKEKEIIFADGLFPRIGSGQETWHECKFCDARKVCFKKELPVRNCRTCQHVIMEDGGIWSCGIKQEQIIGTNETVYYQLSTTEQALACDKYELDEILK